MVACPVCGKPLIFLPELNRKVCGNPQCPLSRKGKPHREPDGAIRAYERVRTALDQAGGVS